MFGPGGDAGAGVVAKTLGGLPTRPDATVPPNTVRVLIASDYHGPGAVLTQPSGDSADAAPPPPPQPPITADGIPCVELSRPYPREPMTVTDALLAPVLAADARRPLITFYDDATGERLEFSGETLANWIAKTANFLRDECDVEPGMRVAVLLPAHWQTAVALLGAWWNGAVVTDDPAGRGRRARRRRAPRRGRAGRPRRRVLARRLRPPARRSCRATPSTTRARCGCTATRSGRSSPSPVTRRRSGDASVDEVVATARRRATELGYDAGSRVLSVADWPLRLDVAAAGNGLVDGLFAVLAAGGSLVQVRHPDLAALDRKAEVERATPM